jgi:hypothetical protein
VVATQVLFFVLFLKREEKEDNDNAGTRWWLRRDCYCLVPNSKRKIRKRITTMNTRTQHTRTSVCLHTPRGMQTAQFVSFFQAQHIFFRPRTCTLSTPSTA